MVKIVLLSVAVLSISACSNTNDVSHWQGESLGKLVNNYGPPSNFIKLDDGSTIVEFDVNNNQCTLSFIVNNTNSVVGGSATRGKSHC